MSLTDPEHFSRNLVIPLLANSLRAGGAGSSTAQQTPTLDFLLMTENEALQHRGDVGSRSTGARNLPQRPSHVGPTAFPPNSFPSTPSSSQTTTSTPVVFSFPGTPMDVTSPVLPRPSTPLRAGASSAAGPSFSPPAAFPHGVRRSEAAKCRRVYGAVNKSKWCKQCRWKKACTRFQGPPHQKEPPGLS